LPDDHETVREGLKAIVNAQADMNVIGEAADGNTAVQLAIATNPDVVLMDASMPHLNGLEATKLIKTRCPDVKVLALTRYSDAGYIRQLLAAGASGYVLKQSRSVELLQALRTVGVGSTYLDPTAAAKLAADNAMQKLGFSSRTDVVKFALVQGWLNEGEAPQGKP
jgi:DNA-binding NarL/FixJ family response regulator